MRLRTARLVVAIAATAALATCASAAARDTSAPPTPAQDAPSVEVRVVNNNFYDADVYVVAGDAVVRRLGTVDGNSVRTFVLVGAQAAPGAQLAFYARTIGEGREYRSGVVMVLIGNGVQWILEPHGLDWLSDRPPPAKAE